MISHNHCQLNLQQSPPMPPLLRAYAISPAGNDKAEAAMRAIHHAKITNSPLSVL